MQLSFNSSTGLAEDLPGVHVRIPGFGHTHAVEWSVDEEGKCLGDSTKIVQIWAKRANWPKEREEGAFPLRDEAKRAITRTLYGHSSCQLEEQPRSKLKMLESSLGRPLSFSSGKGVFRVESERSLGKDPPSVGPRWRIISKLAKMANWAKLGQFEFPRHRLDASKRAPGRYFATIVDSLVSRGYRRGVDIVGAPYDWRRAPSE